MYFVSELIDYRIPNAPISFINATGNQTQCTYVQIMNDDIIEADETFSIRFSSDSRFVNVLTPLVSVTITDDDQGMFLLKLK